MLICSLISFFSRNVVLLLVVIVVVVLVMLLLLLLLLLFKLILYFHFSNYFVRDILDFINLLILFSIDRLFLSFFFYYLFLLFFFFVVIVIIIVIIVVLFVIIIFMTDFIIIIVNTGVLNTKNVYSSSNYFVFSKEAPSSAIKQTHLFTFCEIYFILIVFI